jgi:4-hydroxy-tetrahydrodipicolinate synthase
MSVETMARLFELKNIVGVKDATGDLNRVDKQLKAMGREFIQLTGMMIMHLSLIEEGVLAQLV